MARITFVFASSAALSWLKFKPILCIEKARVSPTIEGATKHPPPRTRTHHASHAVAGR